jgi:hypothetical protein
MNTLDYVRDNRLRLWFLDGYADEGKANPRNLTEFTDLIFRTLLNLRRMLRPDGFCVMVTGEISKGPTASVNTSEAILRAAEMTNEFVCEGIVEDEIPMMRRVRKEGTRVKREWIVVLRKKV